MPTLDQFDSVQYRWSGLNLDDRAERTVRLLVRVAEQGKDTGEMNGVQAAVEFRDRNFERERQSAGGMPLGRSAVALPTTTTAEIERPRGNPWSPLWTIQGPPQLSAEEFPLQCLAPYRLTSTVVCGKWPKSDSRIPVTDG